MLRNQRRRWTEEEDRRLLELRATGRSVASIAVALRLSAKAIRLRLAGVRSHGHQGHRNRPEHPV